MRFISNNFLKVFLKIVKAPRRSLNKRRRSFRREADISPASFDQVVWVESGVFDKSKITLYSIFRDEMYFCSAFFDYYRSIGIEQFLILDDNSTDGTHKFLASQADCVLLKSKLSYGQTGTIWIKPDGATDISRAGIALKCLIPNHFCLGQFALYMDADEFMILPPNISTVAQLIDSLKASGSKAVEAQLVEFFPERLPLRSDSVIAPLTSQELFSEDWFYESKRLVSVDRERTIKHYGTKSELLFEQYKIGGLQIFNPTKRSVPRSPRSKIPLLEHSPKVFRTGSHGVNVPVTSKIVLSVVHFVWTKNFFNKVEKVIQWKSHYKKGEKYQYYMTLLDAIEATGGSMLGPDSKKFVSINNFNDDDNMVWSKEELRS